MLHVMFLRRKSRNPSIEAPRLTAKILTAIIDGKPPPSQAPLRRYMRSVNGKKRRFKDKRKRRAKRRDVAASEMDLQGGTVEKRLSEVKRILRQCRSGNNGCVARALLCGVRCCVVSLILAQLALVLPTTTVVVLALASSPHLRRLPSSSVRMWQVHKPKSRAPPILLLQGERPLSRRT